MGKPLIAPVTQRDTSVRDGRTCRLLVAREIQMAREQTFQKWTSNNETNFETTLSRAKIMRRRDAKPGKVTIRLQ